jgi:peptidoglycan/LPS O-acetylase OafA/YrhL
MVQCKGFLRDSRDTFLASAITSGMSMIKAISRPGALRFFLALSVFVHHLTRFAIGSSAVYLFFVLSGYWIYQMWTVKYIGTLRPYATYSVSRLWRLLPLFWICSALTFALNPVAVLSGGSGFHYWASQVMIFGYSTMPFQPNLPAWSLDVEMQFYVIAPLLAAALLRLNAVAVLVIIAAASVATSLYWGQCLASCLIFFALGMAASHWKWRPGPRVPAMSIAAVVLVIIGCLVVPAARSLILVGAHPGPLSWANPYLQVVLVLLAIPYAIWTTHQLSSRFDKILADASYALYLLHWPLVKWTFRHGLAKNPSYLLVLLAVAVCLALVLVVGFDAPLQRWRNKWVRSRQATGSELRQSSQAPIMPSRTNAPNSLAGSVLLK